jgi:choice-of-anchor A domain-containing protein
MRWRQILPAAIVAAGSVHGAASAATLTSATILKDFNAIVFGDASTTSDIEGAAVVGGNFSGATMYNHPTASQPSGFGALTVYGATSGNPINLNNGGNAYVAGAHGAIVNFNGGGHYIGAPAAAVTDFSAPLTALSTSLSTLAATASLPTPDNNEVIKAVPNASGIAVFNLSASDLSLIPSYKIDLNGASTLVFNVSGTAINFNANDESGVAGANNIIWNFYQADNVNLVTQIAGTVLAPLAAVTNGNQIDGALVAKSWKGNGELHDYGFTGTLPSAAPEPGAWGLMIAGFFGVGGVLRSRRKAARVAAA